MDENKQNIHMCTPQWTQQQHNTHNHSTDHDHGNNNHRKHSNSNSTYTTNTTTTTATANVFIASQQAIPSEHHHEQCTHTHTHILLETQVEKGFSTLDTEQSHMFMQACYGKWCIFPIVFLDSYGKKVISNSTEPVVPKYLIRCNKNSVNMSGLVSVFFFFVTNG